MRSLIDLSIFLFKRIPTSIIIKRNSSNVKYVGISKEHPFNFEKKDSYSLLQNSSVISWILNILKVK